MNHSTGRRRFLQVASATPFLAMPIARPARAGTKEPSETLVVGIMGTGGRGTDHLRSLRPAGGRGRLRLRRRQRAPARPPTIAGRKGKKTPKPSAISARSSTTRRSTSWSSPPATTGTPRPPSSPARPASTSTSRSRAATTRAKASCWSQAARKHKRSVQMGNQRRSWPKIIEAIEQVRDGAIGRAYFAQCVVLQQPRRRSARASELPVPEGLDYDLWQGPAPRRPFHDNYLHYNWHWFWHWGNGELGNNGIHMIDLCRWGLGVEYPTRVTSSGGRYRFEDDQETPDTHIVSFDFDGRKTITWEGLSCNPVRPGKAVRRRSSTATTGTLAHRRTAATRIHDAQGQGDQARRTARPATPPTSPTSSTPSAARRSSTARSRKGTRARCCATWATSPTAPAARCAATRRTATSSTTREAMALWTREYAKGWEPRGLTQCKAAQPATRGHLDANQAFAVAIFVPSRTSGGSGLSGCGSASTANSAMAPGRKIRQ